MADKFLKQIQKSNNKFILLILMIIHLANGHNFQRYLFTNRYIRNENISPYSFNFSSFSGSEWIENCPCRQCGLDTLGNREIICDSGGIVDIPFERISPFIDTIDISAPDDNPNNLTLGPLFYRFPQLKKLRITKSNIPAIGPTTFRYRTLLSFLDLSQNRIQHLIGSNFYGLSKLKMLNLSHNHLSELASGTFQQLYNLKHLDLAHNNLTTITTRLFYNLSNLETLDLSNNPIGNIPPRNIIDLRSLKELSLANCSLRHIHSLLYHQLPSLKILDLRDNYLNIIHLYEFTSLKNLTHLYLDHNQLFDIDAYAFYGLNLSKLSLSNNNLSELNSNTFFNSTIMNLDLSGNNFTKFDSNILNPLKNHLKILSLNNIETLNEPSISLSRLLAPLKTLEEVELSCLRLDSLSPDLFTNNRQTLRYINLSHNLFVNISARSFDELYNLQILDLSHNSLYELSSDFLYILTMYKNLSFVYFDHNPWSCYRCHLLYFRNWITNSNYSDNNGNGIRNPYQKACQIDGRCAICRYPSNLEGHQVDGIEESQLEWCTDPTVHLRVSTTEPNVGLVLALLIIIILIIVIIGVIVYYRNRGAIYFTNEDLFYGRASNIEDGKSSSVYNISNAIRYFADATASPPDSPMSLNSIDESYKNFYQHLQQNYYPQRRAEQKASNGQLYAQIHRNRNNFHTEMKPQTGYGSVGRMVKIHPRLSSDVSIISHNKTYNSGNIRAIQQYSPSHDNQHHPLRHHRSQSSNQLEDEQLSLSIRSPIIKSKCPKKVLMVEDHSIIEPGISLQSLSSVPIRPKHLNSLSISSTTSSNSGSASNKKKREAKPPPSPPPPSSSSSPSTVSHSPESEEDGEEEGTNISENIPSTLCPHEEVKHDNDEEEDEEQSSENDANDEDVETISREPSPSGSIDLSPPTEMPIMKHDDYSIKSSVDSLTAALAENDGDSNCSAASAQSSLELGSEQNQNK